MATEKRLIDAYALKSQITRHHMSLTPRYISKLVDAEIGDVIDIIDETPTVDAVEVVRCKDCIHRGEEGECPMYFVQEIEWDDDGYTEWDYVPHDYTVDDGFCDRGERKDND